MRLLGVLGDETAVCFARGLPSGRSWRDACSAAASTLQQLSLLCICLLCLQIDSKFAEAYNSGVHKSK
jgi:hypothetical protein